MTIKIMVNGLPGNMSAEVLLAASIDDKFILIPYSLTGPEIKEESRLCGGAEYKLVKPDAAEKSLTQIRSEHGSFITIDFTHPAAVNGNAEIYCKLGLPFVMGTTGGKRDELMKTAEQASISAVIAPNMAKQIVGFQMMLEYASENFPGLFEEYSMTIEESHQSGKADTSGTAKAMVSYFNRMGIDFDIEDIKKERDPETQKTELNIPEENLTGHAYHTYSIISPDKTVDFQFQHNVRGRRIYALGALDAARFLHERVENGDTQVFSMIDILKAGKMK